MTALSVLISIYHRESPSALDICLKSLADQHQPADEIVMVWDGPIGDELQSVVRKWQATLPIKILALEENAGLGVALNKGLLECSHEIVARMDGDDISKPERFKLQYEYLQQHPDIAIVGSWIMEFDRDIDNVYAARKVPVTPEETRAYIVRRSPLNHPTVMFRKSVILSVGNYQTFVCLEDYHLWARVAKAGHKIANIPEYLLFFRAGPGMVSRRGGLTYFRNEIKLHLFMRELGLIGWPGLLANVLLRAPIRLAPAPIRAIIYRYGLRSRFEK